MNHAHRDFVNMLSPDTHALVARAEAIFAETRETEEALEENIRWSWELRQQIRDLKMVLWEHGCRLRELRQQIAAACGQSPTRRSDSMTRTDFTAALQQEFRRRGIPFQQRDLSAFVPAAWPLIEERPDVTFWANELVEASRAAGVTVKRVMHTFAKQ